MVVLWIFIDWHILISRIIFLLIEKIKIEEKLDKWF
jgi:hypothetical protein